MSSPINPFTAPPVDARLGFTETFVEDNTPITGAQFEAGIDKLISRVAAICEMQSHTTQEAIHAGTRQALTDILNDNARVKQFWRTGFDELTMHGGNEASQWVGKRLITGLIVAIMVGCITWLVQTGRLK
jgi:hypothetical protein